MQLTGPGQDALGKDNVTAGRQCAMGRTNAMILQLLVDLEPENIRCFSRTVQAMDAPRIEANRGRPESIEPVRRCIHRAQQTFELAKGCCVSGIVLWINRNRFCERLDCTGRPTGDDERFCTGRFAIVTRLGRLTRDRSMGLFEDGLRNRFARRAMAGDHAHRRRIDT